jgi:hypothetical protein
MSDNLAEVKFHFFGFLFTPHAENSDRTSTNILKDCIQRINDERIENSQAIVIDLHEGRKDQKPRIIFISSAAYVAADKKYKCRIALIRNDKIPQIVDRSNYTLTPFDQLGKSVIAETANFYIDVSGDIPIVCCEFNNIGPRVLDIEAYFRFLSSHRMLHISKACKASIHMKIAVNDVLDAITDVFRFEIKANPKRLAHISQSVDGSFVHQMQTLANSVNPKSIRVESFFRQRGPNTTGKKNVKAVAMMKKFLKAFSADLAIAEDFDEFELEFEREDGSEDTFNLIKGKQEIIAECQYSSSGNYDTKELYNNAKVEFDEYLAQRKK